MTRAEAATALAKVFAFVACGKTAEARRWAQTLIDWLKTI